jgi:hypothetical protein
MGNFVSSADSPKMSVDPSAKSFIESEISAHQVTIFSKTYCGKCAKTRVFSGLDARLSLPIFICALLDLIR